jgi:hypothetical protein
MLGEFCIFRQKNSFYTEGVNEKSVASMNLQRFIFFLCDLAGIRTQDPLIKSQMLYQLSYQIFPTICIALRLIAVQIYSDISHHQTFFNFIFNLFSIHLSFFTLN